MGVGHVGLGCCCVGGQRKGQGQGLSRGRVGSHWEDSKEGSKRRLLHHQKTVFVAVGYVDCGGPRLGTRRQGSSCGYTRREAGSRPGLGWGQGWRLRAAQAEAAGGVHPAGLSLSSPCPQVPLPLHTQLSWPRCCGSWWPNGHWHLVCGQLHEESPSGFGTGGKTDPSTPQSRCSCCPGPHE